MNGIPEVQMCEDVPIVSPIILTEKRCPKCKQLKLISKFYKSRSQKDGLSIWCKECNNKQKKAWRQANPEKSKEANCKCWLKQNMTPQERNERLREYRKNNPDKVREQRKKDYNKYQANPKNKIAHSMRTGMYVSLKKNKRNKSWEKLVGYSRFDLMQHLEKLFTKGMNWENYGKWHIDHKIPIAVFNYEKPEDIDFRKCWALSNLQPLWASENIKKGARLERPLQPSFLV